MHTASPLYLADAMTDRIRTTITITPEVHEVFSRMAETSGMSLGRCIGEWLEDTIEGAQFVSSKMAEARRAPAVVMREMQGIVLGLGDEVNAVAEHMRREAAARASAAPGSRRLAPSPPSSNTGGKVTTTKPKRGAR